MFTMKREVAGRSDDLFQSVDKKIVNVDASRFQNIHVNFHKFGSDFSTRLWEIG
jgi:hypothetical protein